MSGGNPREALNQKKMQAAAAPATRLLHDFPQPLADASVHKALNALRDLFLLRGGQGAMELQDRRTDLGPHLLADHLPLLRKRLQHPDVQPITADLGGQLASEILQFHLVLLSFFAKFEANNLKLSFLFIVETQFPRDPLLNEFI